MKARMVIIRGQTTYDFEADDFEQSPNNQLGSALAQLAQAEAWVFDSPNRLSKLDEAERFRAAQPGDTVQMRTR